MTDVIPKIASRGSEASSKLLKPATGQSEPPDRKIFAYRLVPSIKQRWLNARNVVFPKLAQSGLPQD